MEQITIRVPASLRERLKRLAKLERRAESHEAVWLLEGAIARREREKPASAD